MMKIFWALRDKAMHNQNLKAQSTYSNIIKGEPIVEPTALQKHLMFFDCNNDGLVYPWESYQGLRAIGCGIIISAIGTFFFNCVMGPITRPGKCCCLLFPIDIKNIVRAMHCTDSGVYDSEGRFQQSKFEEIFQMFANSNQNSLTFFEVLQLLEAVRKPFDFYGWVVNFGEWMLLYILGKDEHGLLQKETIRGVYDGTLFWKLANKNASKKQL